MVLVDLLVRRFIALWVCLCLIVVWVVVNWFAHGVLLVLLEVSFADLLFYFELVFNSVDFLGSLIVLFY